MSSAPIAEHQQQQHQQDYEIRQAEQPSETAQVLALLREHFFPVEPLFSAYLTANGPRITAQDEATIADDLDRYHRALIEAEMCLVVVERASGRIVGAALAKPEMRSRSRGEENGGAEFTDTAHDHNSSAPHPIRLNSKWMYEWFNGVLFATGDVASAFDEFPDTESALDILIVCVAADHCGRGLATRLIRAIADVAREAHYDLVTGLFTSAFSARAALKLGFRAYADIDWLSFRDSRGKLFYEGRESYVFSLMALRLT